MQPSRAAPPRPPHCKTRSDVPRSFAGSTEEQPPSFFARNRRALTYIFLLCFVLLGVVSTWSMMAGVKPHKVNVTAKFKSFIQKFGKKYRSEDVEEDVIDTFRSNLLELEEEAAHQPGLKVGYHKWMDLSKDEMREKLNLLPVDWDAEVPVVGEEEWKKLSPGQSSPYRERRSSWHDREKGRRHSERPRFSPISDGEKERTTSRRTSGRRNKSHSLRKMATSVKDQGDCGSCWAFATVAAVETARAVARFPLTNLSEQHLVDCERVSDGCDGGYIQHAMRFVKEYGLVEETSYPYNGVDNMCGARNKTRVFVSGVKSFSEGAEEEMADWLFRRGPMAFGMDITQSFMGYQGGVYAPSEEDCWDAVGGHAMAIMGYGTEEGQDYWLVKNSWGEDWGDHGYVKIARGINACGLADRVVAPIIR